MIGTLLLYAEQLVLYHLGAFVCFDRKSRAPLPQLAGGVICLKVDFSARLSGKIAVDQMSLCAIYSKQVSRCGGEIAFSQKGDMFCVRVSLPNGK